jgi:hypothetical protein
LFGCAANAFISKKGIAPVLLSGFQKNLTKPVDCFGEAFQHGACVGQQVMASGWRPGYAQYYAYGWAAIRVSKHDYVQIQPIQALLQESSLADHVSKIRTAIFRL